MIAPVMIFAAAPLGTGTVRVTPAARKPSIRNSGSPVAAEACPSMVHSCVPVEELQIGRLSRVGYQMLGQGVVGGQRGRVEMPVRGQRVRGETGDHHLGLGIDVDGLTMNATG
jgi:hypothetical protein